MQHLTAVERRAAISLALVFAFRMLGLFMLIPVFAIFGKDLIGFSPLWIGLAIGAYGLTQAVLQIPMGWASDRFGRKPVMFIGLTLFVLGSVVAALSDSVYGVTAGRVLQGMGAISGAVLALASDVTREEQRPKVMAVIGMTIGLSFAVAMVAGPAIAAVAGLSGIFWFTACIALCGILLVWKVVPEAAHKVAGAETLATPGKIAALFSHPQLLRLNFGVLVLHMLLTAMFVVLPPLLVQQDFLSASHWQLYLPVILLAFVAMVPLMIIASRKQQEKRYFLLGISLLIVSFVLILSNQQLWCIALALLLFFTGFNYLEASMPALLSRIAPAGLKGTAMGTYASAQFFGAFLGGLFGGWISGALGSESLFVFLALIGLIWLVCASSMTVPERSQRLSLPVNVANQAAADALAARLCHLPGVQEATVLVAEQRCYLKVGQQNFNLAEAQSLVAGGSRES
ncbi:MFS transporter [Rheinheimera sp.]|uniref:MFS transporter n=1 Tax=Rheinheimera sp. TaxID=1869214 RepID=UPI003AF5EFB3